MSFFQNIFSTAKNIVNKGKDVLADQLSSETTYERDATGNFQMTSTTGNKPKIVGTAKEFLIPGRGYTDQEIKDAPVNTKDTAIGVAKTAGEIVKGGTDILAAIGRPIANTVLPGYKKNVSENPAQVEARQRYDEYVAGKLAPTNASQAKVMRGGDILGLAPIGSVSKLSKLDQLSDVARNSLKTEKLGVRDKSLDYFRNNPEQIKTGEVRIRELEDGSIFIEDGRHRLEVGREKGITPNIVDVTAEYTGKPSDKVANIIADIKSTPDVPVKTANLDKAPVAKAPTPTPKQFDIPKKPTGEIDVDSYVAQQTKAREAARGEGRTIKSRATEFLQNLENKAIDFTSPIQRRVDAAKKSDPLSMSGKSEIKDNIDRVFNAPAITSAFVKEKGFSEIVQRFDEKDLDAFDQYLTAKHAVDLESKGINTGRSTQADLALIEQLGPKFDDAAKDMQKYNDARLQYMVDSGLISEKTKTDLLTKHPNYVPFQRVFSEDELANSGGFGSSGVANLSKQTVVQKIVGSNREIESPLESLLELTSKAVQQGEKNKAALTLTSYADLPNNPFGLRKITKTTDAAPDKGTITVLRDGKKEIWEVDTDVAKAAKALDVERMNILGKILAAPLRLARLGITGVNVPFVAANVVRDQMSAFIMSDKGLKSSVANPRIWLAGLGEAISHGKLYDEMLSEGALMTSFDVIRDSAKPTLKGIVADKSRVSKAKYIARNPKEWFRAVEDIIGRSEEVTRMQQYAGNKAAAIAEGATEAEARVIAARAARENSTNFARRGEWGTVMNNTILYLNAGLQGSRLLVRNLKNKPVKTTTKIASTLMLPTATITYWNLSDPERKAAYEDIQEYEKENNFIIVPPNPTKDEDGRWNVIKVPLPPGVGQFANFVRRPIESSQGLDETGFAEAAGNLLSTFSPVNVDTDAPFRSLFSTFTPQILKPGAQAVTNMNLFTGNDIVPKNLQDLPPEQQIKDNTSGTARIAGQALGASPIKTEQFINDTLGGIGPQILNASDNVLSKVGVIDEDEVGGRSIPESVARRFSSAAGNKLQSEQLDEIYSLRSEARGESAKLSDLAENTLAELNNLQSDQAKAEMKRLYTENKPLYDKVLDLKKDEKAGLSKVESAIKQLPVKDGTRAAYIYDQYLEIQQSSPEDAKAYLKDLRAKKVISDEVLEQLVSLRKGDTIE